ncbi:YHS domain-containing (seleno)protein [Vibrio sp. DNB22_10_4]
MPLFKLFASLYLWLVLAASAYALEPVYSDFFGKAIRGYDPVDYFTQGKPVKGNSDYTYDWNDATWYFSSKQNQDLFTANPDRYAPQYGGYCAWAVSKGYTAKIDPNAWYIHDDKLYLNYSKSVQSTWQQNIPGNIASADLNWPSLLKQ